MLELLDGQAYPSGWRPTGISRSTRGPTQWASLAHVPLIDTASISVRSRKALASSTQHTIEPPPSSSPRVVHRPGKAVYTPCTSQLPCSCRFRPPAPMPG